MTVSAPITFLLSHYVHARQWCWCCRHATFSRHHHGLAEDLRPEDEGGPDVGPDRQVGGLTGVVSHVNLGPELSLLVLDGVCGGLKHDRNGGMVSLSGQYLYLR